MHNQPDSVQFSITRTDTNTYKIVVQDDKQIIRSSEVGVAEVMDKLGFELEQLKSR